MSDWTRQAELRCGDTAFSEVRVEATRCHSLVSVTLYHPDELSQLGAAMRRLNLPLAAPREYRSVPQGTVLFAGQGRWLLEDFQADPRLLQAELDHCAAVVDVSSAYLCFQVTGVNAAAILSHGLKPDLSPAAFPPGEVLLGQLAYLPVLVQRTAADHFNLRLGTSYREYFESWLRHHTEPQPQEWQDA